MSDAQLSCSNLGTPALVAGSFGHSSRVPSSRLCRLRSRSNLTRSWYARTWAMESHVGTSALIPAGSKRATKTN